LVFSKLLIGWLGNTAQRTCPHMPFNISLNLRPVEISLKMYDGFLHSKVPYHFRMVCLSDKLRSIATTRQAQKTQSVEQSLLEVKIPQAILFGL